MSRLLLEIGTEAIPAGYLPPALAALRTAATDALSAARLPAGEVRVLGTPKRLVLEVEDLASGQPDRVREVTGPRADVAFRDGKPTAAAEGFARKNGVAVESLERVTTEKGEFLLARVQETGRPAVEVLPDLLTGAVAGLPWPKTMVWNPTRYRFPRPVRWVVCLLDEAVLPLEVGGLPAGRASRGHALLGPGPVEVAGAGDLSGVLEDRGVLLDPERRRRIIADGLEREAATLGGRLVPDPGLLDEVVFLVEHPQVLSGRFDAEFARLPREVVVTAMRAHQRYFAVESEAGELQPYFLVVADGAWDDPGQVVAGNERVLRARLSDARFYWDVDRRTGLDRLAEALGGIVWLEAVGTLADKAERVARLVERLGTQWFAADWPSLRKPILRATRLAKADLASEMIKDGKEFTGLQGTIGARYAESAGEPESLSRALIEQYLPRGAGDPLPATAGGTLLAFADRLDTVAGCWAAGFVPTGSQDPYALRRAANGMVRMLLEKELHASLAAEVAAAVEGLPASVQRDGLAEEVLGFLADRTAYFLRERGMRYDVVEAVLAADADDPLDALARAGALTALRESEALERLVVGFKRAANILKGIDESALPDPASVDWKAADPAEAALHRAVARIGKALPEAREGKDYAAMLGLLLELREPIDVFFDKVLVMSEDPAERARRLALLAEARGLFAHFFDPARIVIEGEGTS